MNIRGLYPMRNRTKVAYLKDLAAESNAPFIALTETHLSANVYSAEVEIPGYTLYRSDRSGGRTHGGCATYCREDLTVIERASHSNNFCESQVLEVKELELILINIYRPPKSPKETFKETLEKCQESIDEVMDKLENKSRTLLALGDYNFPFIKWPSRRIYTRDEEPDHMDSEKEQAKLLMEWTDHNFMEQTITTPTRKNNILDLVFTNSENLLNGYSMIINCNFSDYNILRISLNYSYKNEKETKRESLSQ